MRPLRWKSRYAYGDLAIDQRNKRFVACLNQLIASAGQREHCQDLARFLTQLGTEVEAHLDSHGTVNPLLMSEFYPMMIAALPLSSFETGACRQCGLCEMAQAKIAEHLQAPMDCLSRSHP